MFFTQYSPILFLTAGATGIFVLFILLYIYPKHSGIIRKVSLLLGVLLLAGLVKYRLATRPFQNEIAPVFFSLIDSIFAGVVLSYYAKLRWPNFGLMIRIVCYAYIVGAVITAGTVLIFYPADARLATFIFNIAAFLFALPLVMLTGRHHFMKLSLLSKIIHSLAVYVAVADMANMLSISGSWQSGWYKLDVFVYAAVFWLLIIHYLPPKNIAEESAAYATPATVIDQSVMEECLSALENAFKDRKLYLDPGLTLASLAAEINISSRTISFVLNNSVQKNFHEYLNEYRVAEAKKLLADYRKRNSTIAAVAYDAGFNSLATFQRVFKKASGKTPREFSEN